MLTTTDPASYKFFNTPNQTKRPFPRVSQNKGHQPSWNHPIRFAGTMPQDAFIPLEQQNDINSKDFNGDTALIRASKDGHEAVVEKLLNHPNIDINTENKYGRTALILASRDGHEKVAEILLKDPNIKINAKDKDGNTALVLASMNGHKTVIIKLLKHPKIDLNVKDIYGDTTLIRASSNGHETIVEKLLSQPKTDINAIDKDGKTALIRASSNGHETVVEKLLSQSNIDINAKDKDEKTALVWASMYGNESVVEKLLNQPNIDINARNDRGYTALAWAAINGNETVVEKLLNHPNIDINAKNKDGQIALTLASMYGHETVVEKLFSQPNIDINAKDNNGNTALSWAAINGNETVVEKLLNHPNIDINAKNNNGQTALTLASMYGHETVFQKLVLNHTLELSPDAKQKLALHLLMVKHLILMGKHLTDLNPTNRGTLAFVSLLPDLLLNHSINYLNDNFAKIEQFFDTHPTQRNFHPYEAELLVMLKHPELWDRYPQKTSRLTRCLTSISHFIDVGAKLSDETLKTWGDIGFLTHGFRFWRYDTLGGSQSLLAQFGFRPAPESRPLNEVFGKGFLYKDQPSGSLVEFRRGYLLITHPEKGTLVIRNSSPMFGRDLLRHPAYYLKKPLIPNELLSFDPRTLNDQDSILYRDHYPNRNNSDSHSAKSISALTETLLEINDQYRKFKLDTEAFENGTFTGHLSPGLPKLVNVLNQLKAQGKPLPDLAFTQPEFPPYQPYFYFDGDMKKTDRFPLTPSHLQELNDFVSGQWSEKKYLESDWIRFLTQAGVENHGELVMLEPTP
jgi:ankyrin repeat protein